MLRSIELENYRRFKRYRLSDLARVNLLVGRNNCGKTSVLEAVYLLASGGDPRVLCGVARQRGEVVLSGEDSDRYRQRAYPVVTHFFHGHEFGPDAHFSVRTENEPGGIVVHVIDVAELEKQPSLFEEGDGSRSTLAVRIEGATHPLAQRGFPVSDEGAIHADLFRGYGRPSRPDRGEAPSVQFIAPDSLEPRSMSEMWNRVIIEGRETEVIDAMRILEPGLTNIFFLSGESPFRNGGRAGILAAFEGTRRRDPLGSYGDGMRRLLALTVSLIETEGGILLVDEIDTALHYSIMGDMWRLVVEAAKRSNVQVFATTHSADCVRGLAWLCEAHPDLRQEVSLQKIEPQLEQAVGLDAEGILIADRNGLEVR